MLLKQLCNCEAFRANKGEEPSAYHGFKDSDDEECEDVEAGSAAGQEPGGAINKYTFCKFSQIVFSQGFASAKCMYLYKLSQI